MSTSPSHHAHSADLLKKVAQKLGPQRFPHMSGLMAVIVAFLIDRPVTTTAIAEIVVTPDGLLVAAIDDDLGTSYVIGTYVDLLRNWLALIEVAGLTQDERILAETLFASKIGYFGRAQA
jgi:hypothetical protein